MLFKFLLDTFALRCFSCEENVGDACFSLLKHNVLQFLYVPSVVGEDGEAMGEHADLIQVSDLDLVHLRVVHISGVDPVSLIQGTFTRELLDDSYCFLADSSLCLLGARAAMVSSVHSWVLCKRVSEVTLLCRWFTNEDIASHPEVLAFFEFLQ